MNDNHLYLFGFEHYRTCTRCSGARRRILAKYNPYYHTPNVIVATTERYPCPGCYSLMRDNGPWVVYAR